ncbi:translocation/assembly module TamB domain-containing protein [uncultured Cohaesibacter sp.]|uniref:translocation/assembly module TamB domain-containing protein n=1 Tax=uncultured Cohaesibacter sp. TaxID=1002546 RepID=UPI00292F08D8|nr:translocation/assembly module TamB domain-containing protein [uncultured Cohaesibacter sp.]
MKSIPSLFAKSLYGLFFVILVLLLLGGAMLSTGTGLSMLANLVNSVASSKEQKIEISGLESVLGDIRISAITLADKDGIWLEAKGVDGHYSLTDLFSLNLSVDHFHLSELNIIRAPRTSAAATENTDTTSSGSLVPNLPALGARIGSLSVKKIFLGQTLLGKEATLSLSGQMTLTGRPLSATGTLSLLHLEQDKGSLSASWNIAPEQNRQKLNLSFSEPRGGLLARLIDIADLPAIDITLNGDGPASNWRSDLAIKLDAKPTVEGQVVVALSDKTSRVEAKLLGRLSPFLPQSVLPLVAGTSNLDLLVEQSAKDVIELKQVSFVSGLAKLTGNGFIDNRNSSLDMAMTFDLGEKGTEIEIQQQESASLRLGHVALNGHLAGQLNKAALTLNGSIDSLAQDALVVERTALSVTAPALDLMSRKGRINTSVSITNLSTGSDPIDAILKGDKFAEIDSVLEGSSIELADAKIIMGLASLKAKGSYTPRSMEINGSLALSDLQPVNPELTGSLNGTFKLEGPATAPQITLALGGASLSVYQKAIENLKLDIVASTAPEASLTMSALYDGAEISSSIRLVSNEDGSYSIKTLDLTAPGALITGAVTLAPDGLAAGQLNASVKDFGAFGPLLLQPDLKGSLNADINLSHDNGNQSVLINATIHELSTNGMSLSSLKLLTRIDDALGAMDMNSSLALDRLSASGETVRTLKAEIKGKNGNLPFSVTANLARQPLKLTGRLVQSESKTLLTLDHFAANWRAIDLALLAPAELDLTNGANFDTPLRLSLDRGTVTLSGSAGDAIDLRVGIKDLPISIAEKIAPSGEAPLGQLNLNAHITGSSSSPVANWEGALDGLSAKSTRDAGLPNLAIKTSGQYQKDALTMKNHLSGGGSNLVIDGSIALATQRLNIAANGTVPFSLAARTLADAGLQLAGDADLSANITGTFSAPLINGKITTKGARFSEISSGIILRDLGGTVELTGQQASIQNITGKLGKDGTLAVNGTIGLDANAGMPADISVNIKNADFKYEEILTSLFDATMSLKGPLTGDSVITGRVDVATTEIMIPEKLPASLTPIEVSHKNAEGRVAELAKKYAPKETSDKSAGPAMDLQLVINAPRSIYVRGRGIDAELGGTIRVGGTTADPRPLGNISMQRGRMEILTKRLDFDNGTVSFAGTLDPSLNFEATSTNSGTTYTVTVSGYASAPEIALSSSPSMPEDEILANLFFDKSLSDLSPLQLAQLANAVATLSGANSGPGVLDRLRNMAGIDNIDIKSDDKTNETTVGVGRYINNRTYINIEKSTASDAGKISIDIDITDQIKAHGETATDGDSKAGIFFERDY